MAVPGGVLPSTGQKQSIGFAEWHQRGVFWICLALVGREESSAVYLLTPCIFLASTDQNPKKFQDVQPGHWQAVSGKPPRVSSLDS